MIVCGEFAARRFRDNSCRRLNPSCMAVTGADIEDMSCVATRPIFVWLGLLATFLIPSPAKSLSHTQKCTYIDSAARSNCEAGFSKKVAQEHLATSTVMPVVRFTCCEHLKLPTDSLLQDRSSCQFGELFRKHKLVFTGPVWIAGHVAPLNKCRTVNS